MDTIQLITGNLQRAIDYLVTETKNELLAQGHSATGQMIESARGVVEAVTGDTITGKIEIVDYATFVNTGTRPHFPPFSAIYNWAGIVKPELNEKERKSFTWAVINSIGKHGTPTPGSFKFSQNGRRTEFIKFAINNNRGKFDAILDLFGVFQQIINNSVENLRQNIAA